MAKFRTAASVAKPLSRPFPKGEGVANESICYGGKSGRITLSEGDSLNSATSGAASQSVLARQEKLHWPWRSICTTLRLFHNSTVTTSRAPDRLTARLSAGSLRHS